MYPEAAPAILTDIRLFSTDIQAFTENGTKDLIVRTVFEPATYTCTVSVYVGDQPGGAVGREIARRVIFTGTPVPAGDTSSTTPDPGQVDTPPVVNPPENAESIVPPDPEMVA